MFDRQVPTQFERILERSSFPRSQAAVLAGTSRSLRLSYCERTQDEEEVVQIASGLVAPLSFLFVWWALQTARRHNINRIYFLSRDGQIFLGVAKSLIKAWGLDIDVRYLYCSRESLLAPSFQQVGPFEENWITWGYQGAICVKEICARLGIQIEEFSPFLKKAHLAIYAAHPERIIPKKKVSDIRWMLRDPELCQLVREKIRPRFEPTLEYLLQEGLGDGVPFALLDTGWTGSSQYALGQILQKGGVSAGALVGYYLGVNRESCSRPDDRLEGFLFDWRKSRRDERLYNFICYEMLFSGLHGRTTGYSRSSGGVQPNLEVGLQNFPLAASEIHHRVAEKYAQRVAGLMDFDLFSPEDAARLGRKLMLEFICNPSLEIAETYGVWPMASEIRESDIQMVAPPMGFSQFVRKAVGREKLKGYWPQASLRRGSQDCVLNIYNLFLGFGLLEWYRRLILRY